MSIVDNINRDIWIEIVGFIRFKPDFHFKLFKNQNFNDLYSIYIKFSYLENNEITYLTNDNNNDSIKEVLFTIGGKQNLDLFILALKNLELNINLENNKII